MNGRVLPVELLVEPAVVVLAAVVLDAVVAAVVLPVDDVDEELDPVEPEW